MATAPFPTNPELNTKSALVCCEWLRQNLDRPNQVILDATFFLPRQQRNAQEEFKLEHIPGAQLFDIDEIADLNSSFPHTLPCADQFAQQVGQMGIDNDTWVLIYDNNHFFASARAWWMFRVFGHDNVKIVDGGLTRWMHLSLPLTSDTIKPVPKIFNAEFDSELFLDLEKMQIVQQQGSKLILDARSEDSFNGQRPLNDTGLHPGHIPGSINIPYQKLFAKDDHTLLPVEQLRQVISDAAVDLSKPMVTSCGSGVSAALLLLALYQIGIHEVPMFDGSWAQWGRQTNLPQQTKS
jgi:thiosulfate/3-mercaptopyruvate sulfurtransferase